MFFNLSSSYSDKFWSPEDEPSSGMDIFSQVLLSRATMYIPTMGGIRKTVTRSRTWIKRKRDHRNRLVSKQQTERKKVVTELKSNDQTSTRLSVRHWTTEVVRGEVHARRSSSEWRRGVRAIAPSRFWRENYNGRRHQPSLLPIVVNVVSW